MTRHVEETLEAGDESTQRKSKTKKKEIKKQTLEPEHKETTTRKQYRGPRGDHSVFIFKQHGRFTKAPVTAAALQPDTANAGCTFSENTEPCASAAKPGSGRHAVRQAKISRAKGREGRGQVLVPSKRRESQQWFDQEKE